MQRHKTPRIAYLDGLRGLAICAVVFYHFYGGTFVSWLPYGGRFSQIWPVRYGWSGVQLFFLISGFVILMTLENCRTFSDFIKRRWLRLFPAMLIASLLILVYDHIIDYGPYIDRSAKDLIPGLTFLSPALIHAATKLNLQSMDGPFWSLYVEVCFYAVFGLAFFWRGWKWALGIISTLYIATLIGSALAVDKGSLFWRISSAMSWMGFSYFGWFAAGALFFKAQQYDNRRLFIAAIFVALLCSAVTLDNGSWTVPSFLALMMVVAIFAGAQMAARLQNLLAMRWLLFLGFVSYPLYLIHNNIGIGLTQWLGTELRSRSGWLAVLPIGITIFTAWLIAKYLEGTLRMPLKALLTSRPSVQAKHAA